MLRHCFAFVLSLLHRFRTGADALQALRHRRPTTRDSHHQHAQEDQPLPQANIASYVVRVTDQTRPSFYIERRFQTRDEWNRVSGYVFRNFSFSGTAEANLEDVLAHRTAVILGEPGSGKSTAALAAVERAAAMGWVPLVARLRSYTGNLNALLETTAPTAVVTGTSTGAKSIQRLLILDGFDELREETVDRFINDLDALLAGDPTTNLLLTARQAFYEATRKRFKNPPTSFYLLGLGSRGIREYVEHHGGDYAAFMAEVNRVDLGHEITNPFTLEILYKALLTSKWV